ncbi:MAG: hypothetical protein J6F30_00995 [Cellulosilyticum sp.]|nr:hypothetical protein [Cellulosilyticum sp.]
MGILKKLNCCLCKKELRVTRRTKLQNGEYICDECRRATHPYAHLDRCNKEEVQSMILQMQKDEKLFEDNKVSMEKVHFVCGIHKYTLYTDEYEKVFVIDTIETEMFKYKPIFQVNQVKAYSHINTEKMSVNDEGIRYVTIVAKLDDKGKPRIYYVKFLYDNPKIQKVKIRFEATYVKEARAFCKALNTFIQKNKVE